jgi:hypothetical protein
MTRILAAGFLLKITPVLHLDYICSI